MSTVAQRDAYESALRSYRQAQAALEVALMEMASSAIGRAVPAATSVEVQGELNLDGAWTLRISRILGPAGEVLVGPLGECDASIVEVLEEIETDFLDALMDATGNRLVGVHTWAVPGTGSD